MEPGKHDQQAQKGQHAGDSISGPPAGGAAMKIPSAAAPSFRCMTMVATRPDVMFQQHSSFGPPATSCFASPYAEVEATKRSVDTKPKPVQPVHRDMKQAKFPVNKRFIRQQDARGLQTFKKDKEKTMKPVWSIVQPPPMDVDQKPKAIESPKNKPVLIKLPRYFPLERTNVVIKLEECSLDQLFKRLTDSFRMMSIQAKFMDKPAAYALLTPENVEMYLAFWDSGNGKEAIVEVQRRRGDAVISQQYAHHILGAAKGSFDASAFPNDEGSILYLQATEKKLKMELSRMVPEQDLDKESVVALEIVYGLLKKDRRDARRLGMEGVCILVDARKTLLSAAVLASRALLLGDETAAGQGVHDIILELIQKRSIGNEEPTGEYPIDSDEELYFEDNFPELEGHSPEYKEEVSLLFNLALDALAHALEVGTTFDLGASDLGVSAMSPHPFASVVETFLVSARNKTDMDMQATLLHTMQRAHTNPHNAWLAAKSLRYMCAASPDAAERAKTLGGVQVVGEAFDEGVASHAKLESECRLLQAVLSH